MLVQCRSDVPISLACSMWFGNSLDHGIIETASHMDLEGQASLQAIFPLSQHRPTSEVSLISLVRALLMAARRKSSVQQSYRIAVNIILL